MNHDFYVDISCWLFSFTSFHLDPINDFFGKLRRSIKFKGGYETIAIHVNRWKPGRRCLSHIESSEIHLKTHLNILFVGHIYIYNYKVNRKRIVFESRLDYLDCWDWIYASASEKDIFRSLSRSTSRNFKAL